MHTLSVTSAIIWKKVIDIKGKWPLLTQWMTLNRFDFKYFLDWSRGWELTQNKYGYTSSKSVQLDEFSVLSVHREYSRESFTELNVNEPRFFRKGLQFPLWTVTSTVWMIQLKRNGTRGWQVIMIRIYIDLKKQSVIYNVSPWFKCLLSYQNDSLLSTSFISFPGLSENIMSSKHFSFLGLK